MAPLCGVNPLPASSGKTTRHRLNRGGSKTANNALWTIAMVRMRSDPRTKIYVEQRTHKGLSTKEIHRCLKRYIVRELFPLIMGDLVALAGAPWHRSINAPTERFFRSLKTEWVPETGFSSLPEAQAVIAHYITGYYSLIRPHTFNGGLTPAATEARYQLAS